MAIKPRNFEGFTEAALQVPAKKDWVPDPDAKLTNVPEGEQVRKAGFWTYGYEADHPDDVPTDDLARLVRTPNNPGLGWEQAARNRVRGRLTAIRAFCIGCADGPKKVKLCPQMTCPLWAFRMGVNGLRGKRK